MGSIRPRWRPFAATAAAVLAGVIAFAPRPAAAQDSPLDQARSYYEQAQFDSAITLLRGALASGRVVGAQSVEARELIARCLVRSGRRIEAKQAFKALLYLNPSYRPAPGSMPPDEMEVYGLALEEFNREQIEAGERIPASISFHYGFGSGANEDLGEVVAAGGGDSEFDVDESFGFAVRFPLRPRWSLEIEMQRFRAANEDSFPDNQQTTYEITALPISLSLYYAAITNPKWRVNVFGGVGSLVAATSSINLPTFGSVTLSLSDEKSGFYGHAGLEGEYLVHPRFAAWARVLGRVASVSDLYSDSEIELYVSDVMIKGREISFSGFGAHVGVRAYIGY